MAYGIEVYKQNGYPTLLDTMLGGRVFIELVELSPTTGNPGNITVGTSGSFTYTNVPGHQYLKYYTLQAGQYSISTSTNASSQAVLTFTRQSSVIGSRGSAITIIAVFATRTTDPSHGLMVTNDSGDRLVSSSYVIPVFKGKVLFDASPTYTSGLSRIHEKSVTYGDTNSYKLILYTIPESTNIWFTGDSFIYSGSNPYTLSTTYVLPSAGTTYNLAEAYVFQLNNISSSAHAYGLKVWDGSSPQKLTFDSGLDHINIAGIQESPKISFYDTEQSITNSSLYGNYSAIVIPEYYKEIAERSSPNANSSRITSYRGVFRRQSSTLYYKVVSVGTGFEDAFIQYTYDWGSQYDNTIFIVNTQLLGGTGSGGTGSNTLTASISEGSGSNSCTYSTDYASSCTTSKTYNINTSGGDGTTITYSWSIIENGGGFTLTTASNLSYATLSQSGSTGTYVCILRCTLTQSGVQIIVDYPIEHYHSTASATYSISPNVTTINEGQSVIFTVSTTNVPNNTILYWTINNVSGIDFTPSQTQGSITVGSSSTFTLTAFTDSATEGNETFTVSLRTGSYSGTVVATSQQVTIIDTSTASTGWDLYLSDSSTSINGGSSKTLVFTNTDINGWVSLPTYSFTSNNGNLTISNPSGTMEGSLDSENGSPTYNRYLDIYKQVTITASNINGGNQSVTISAYSPNGVTLRRTLALTINDVVAPTVTLTPASSSISINATTTITVTTSESTSNLTSGDVSVSMGSISNFTGSGTSYSFTYTAPNSGGTATISIAANTFTDSVGNGNTAGSTQVTVVAPTLYSAPAISNFSATPSTGQNETTSRSVTFNFDVTDNTYSGAPRTFYWAIEGGANVTGDDFDGTIYGSLTSINGTVARSASITIKTDATTEPGTEQYRVNFYKDGPYVGTPYYTSGYYTISDTSQTPVVPSYSVSPSSTSVNEGDTLNFSISTSNVSDGTTLYWTISGTNVNGIDYNQTQYQSAIGTTNSGAGASGYATIVHQIYQKYLGRYGDQGGLDYWVGTLVSGANTVQQVVNSIAGDSEATSTSGGIDNGSVTISSGSASVTGTITSDYTTESTETFTFNLRTGSISGTVVATANVNVSSTSQNPSAPSINSFSASPSSISGGDSTTLSWSTSGANVVKVSGVGTYNASTTSVVVSPSSTTTYTLTAINIAGETTATTTVTVSTLVTLDISSVSVSPNPITTAQTSGQTTPYTITVTMNRAPTAGEGNKTIDIQFTNTVSGTLTFENIITVTAGSTTGTFNGNLGTEQGTRSVTIYAQKTGFTTRSTTWQINAYTPPADSWYNIISVTGSNSTTTAGPVNQYWRRYILAFTYSAAEITAATGKTNGTIKQLRFNVTGVPTYTPLPSYAIGLKNLTSNISSNPGGTGYSIVKVAEDFYPLSGYNTFDTADFVWTGNNLAIVFAWGQSPTNWSFTGQTNDNSSSGVTYYLSTDGTGTYTINSSGDLTTTRAGRPCIELYM